MEHDSLHAGNVWDKPCLCFCFWTLGHSGLPRIFASPKAVKGCLNVLEELHIGNFY